MESTLKKNTSRIRLMSRGQTYYRNIQPSIKKFDEQGEFVELMSRGVAYKKKFVARIYKKPNIDALNWRWRALLSQDLG